MIIINGEKVNVNGLILDIKIKDFSISYRKNKPFAKIRYRRMEKLQKALFSDKQVLNNTELLNKVRRDKDTNLSSSSDKQK